MHAIAPELLLLGDIDETRTEKLCCWLKGGARKLEENTLPLSQGPSGDGTGGGFHFSVLGCASQNDNERAPVTIGRTVSVHV